MEAEVVHSKHAPLGAGARILSSEVAYNSEALGCHQSDAHARQQSYPVLKVVHLGDAPFWHTLA
jgi:hypothetical protein